LPDNAGRPIEVVAFPARRLTRFSIFEFLAARADLADLAPD
jgi:hypothetical protein